MTLNQILTSGPSTTPNSHFASVRADKSRPSEMVASNSSLPTLPNLERRTPMENVVAPNTRRMILVFAIAMIIAVLAIATFKSRRPTISRDGKLEVSGDLTLSRVVREVVLNAGSSLGEAANAVVNPNLPDGLQIPGRGSVKRLRELGYSEDEINQMWQSFQQDQPGWSQWQNPYGAILP